MDTKHCLRIYAERHGIKYAFIANKAGVSQAMISRLINEPDYTVSEDAAKRIAKACNNKVSYRSLTSKR